MQWRARCGQVLKVEAAYLCNSHSRNLGLLSGVHGNADRCGQAHVAAWSLSDAHLFVIERIGCPGLVMLALSCA